MENDHYNPTWTWRWPPVTGPLINVRPPTDAYRRRSTRPRVMPLEAPWKPLNDRLPTAYVCTRVPPTVGENSHSHGPTPPLMSSHLVGIPPQLLRTTAYARRLRRQDEPLPLPFHDPTDPLTSGLLSSRLVFLTPSFISPLPLYAC